MMDTAGEMLQEGVLKGRLQEGALKERCYRRGPKGEMLQEGVLKVRCYRRGS